MITWWMRSGNLPVCDKIRWSRDFEPLGLEGFDLWIQFRVGILVVEALSLSLNRV